MSALSLLLFFLKKNNKQKVIREIWTKSHRSSRLVSPATLKRVFAKRYPEFQNMTQHDAQEALMALLNELHEEMNVPLNSVSEWHLFFLSFNRD